MQGTLLYSYSAKVDRVVDGDTLAVTLDLGFHILHRQTVRLLDVDTPELPTPEGVAAKQFVINWIEQHSPDGTVYVKTYSGRGRDKYGRYLCRVWGSDGDVLNTSLVLAGHAKPYGV